MPHIRPLILLTATTATVAPALQAAPQAKVMRVAPPQPATRRVATPVASPSSSPQRRATTAPQVQAPVNTRRISFQRMMAIAAMAAVSAELARDPKRTSNAPKPATPAR